MPEPEVMIILGILINIVSIVQSRLCGSRWYWSRQLSVSDLRWETVFTSDLGLDFGIFENRISGTLEHYYTHSSDVLISDSPLSPSSGYSSVTKFR